VRGNTGVSLILNERTKLLATALNNLGVATLIAGVIAPAANVLYGMTNPTGLHPWPSVALIGCCWLFSGVTLHLAAQLVLRRLTP
jgi:hypothetical protein